MFLQDQGTGTMLQLTEVNGRKSTVLLSDGTRWKINPSDAPTIATWLPMASVRVMGKGNTRQIENCDDGGTVEATQMLHG